MQLTVLEECRSAKAINHIGYSLTYTLAIGISAVLGTIFPMLIFGEIGSYFTKPGGGIVLSGMILVSNRCYSLRLERDFKKEKDLKPVKYWESRI